MVAHIFFVRGVLHFVLKLIYYQEYQELQHYTEIGQRFLIPSFVFIMFYYKASDIEQNLIPLNKYAEEDFDFAQRSFTSMVFLDERVVRNDVITRDVVADADSFEINDVYRNIIEQYPASKAKTPRIELEEHHLDPRAIYRSFSNGLWPAGIELDPRLSDASSRSFRRVFYAVALGCILTQLVALAGFLQQAYKDLVVDYWRGHRTEDLAAFIVAAFHAVLIFLFLVISLRGALVYRLCASCTCCARSIGTKL